ncbi:MAG: PKD domain-containing protein [Flavobacteriales bacterium]|nr:PKD domain-containing protein [Flavobacteriales bacterium]
MIQNRFRLLAATLLLSSPMLHAQDVGFHCGANELDRMGTLITGHPERLQEIAQVEAQLEHFTQTWELEAREDGYVIPVVFHIIHNNGSENISNEQVHDAVRVMNEDFNKMTPDWTQVQPEFLSLVADMGITFKLAQLDPDGNCTNGITRTVSTLTNSGDQNMKNLINWPRNRYLNVWVAANAGGAAGYSMYPSSVSGSWGAAADGIVVLSTYVGAIGTSSEGRSHTLSHEAGHWLNLKHCWGDSNDPGVASNCGTDDNVADTPLTIGWTNCSLRGSSCSSLDNVENFMEYSYCSKMFTNGQKARVLAALNSSTASRNNLWTASNLALTGVSTPPQICSVQFNSTLRTICAGQSITFTDGSYNGVTQRQWTFPGGNPASSTSPDPQVTYDTPGQYNVTLSVSNDAQSEEITEQQYVLVLPSTGMPLPVVEGFESMDQLPSENWEVNDIDQDGSFQLSSSAAYSGMQSVRLLNSSAAAGRRDELISNTIDITIAPPAILSFRYAFAKRLNGNSDALRVYASRDCGLTWSLRRTLIGDNLVTAPNTAGSFVPNGPDQWAYNELAPIGGLFEVSNLRIKFVFDSDGGNNFWLDDININGASVGIDEAAMTAGNTVLVVPNPARDRAVVSAYLKEPGAVKVELMDLLGRPVQVIDDGTKPSGPVQWEMDLGSLPSGMYFVRVQQAGGIRVAKFTKE